MITREKRLSVLQRHVERLQRRKDAFQQRSNQLSRWRLLLFVLALIISAVLLLTLGALWWIILTPLLLIPFVVLVYWHRQVETAVHQLSIWQALKQTQLARMQLNWAQLPEPLLLPPQQEHPFARDLDILGERSIHRLLDTAVTQEGSQRLGTWLLTTEPQPAIILARQARVRELLDLTRLRDRLQLNARLLMAENQAKSSAKRPEKQARWQGQRLLDWLAQPDEGETLRPILIVLIALVPVNFILLALNFMGILPPLWFGSWLIYGMLLVSQSNKVTPVFKDAAYLADSLRTLNGIFQLLERYNFNARASLQQLCAPFLAAAERPSAHLRRVNWVMAGAGLRYNPMVAILLNAVIPWDTFFAYRFSRIKAELQDLLPSWLDIWFELEALNSLANFAYTYPETVFPQIITLEADELPFVGKGLGHPLIAAEERICNDFMVGSLGNITIITGSNMAGKSSFLRTLGVNLCLAQAGGLILGNSLRSIPFRLAASITVTDSVSDGFSFFYAEVRRLKSILASVQQADAWPLFFMIDEIFRGTNNRERLIGSRAYVRALIGCAGIGVIATHDLELVRLEDESTHVRNFHFRDDVVNGRMVFDYKLHPGPCPTTNALKIMQLAGLPVDIDKKNDTELHRGNTEKHGEEREKMQ